MYGAEKRISRCRGGSNQAFGWVLSLCKLLICQKMVLLLLFSVYKLLATLNYQTQLGRSGRNAKTRY